MMRPLGVFETAQVLTGLYSPFNLVLVLRLERGPDVAVLQRGLRALSGRQPVLRASIEERGNRYCFNPVDHAEIPLEQVHRTGEDDWRPLVERELDTGFPLGTAPLMRAMLLSTPQEGGPCELIITAHHAVIDGASAARMLHDLLTMCAQPDAGRDPEDTAPLVLAPAAEDLFPPRFRGLGGTARQAAFFARQLGGEIGCRFRNRHLTEPAIHPSGHCRIRPFRLSAAQTRTLAEACKSRRLTLNSLLCAAQLLVAHRHGFGRAPMALRHFVFADLRPYLKPPVPPVQLGNYIAMLQLATRVDGDSSAWPLARALTQQVHRASKRGDKYGTLRLSKVLMKAILRAQNMRMGHAALSFSGTVPMSARYGEMNIKGLHAFVSNFVLGPVYTANARIFMGRLCWDMVFVDSDMTDASAREVQESIEDILTGAPRA